MGKQLWLVVFVAAAELLFVAAPVGAQTVNPNGVSQAAANAEAAAMQTRGASATSSGPTVQINSPGQSDNCSLPISGAYGSLALGVTLIWSHADAGCEHIRQAWALNGLGYPKAAVQVMCELPTVRKAMKQAGTPCDAQH